MLPTDKICTKIEGAAITNLSCISKQSQFLLQQIQLVYGIYRSYK